MHQELRHLQHLRPKTLISPQHPQKATLSALHPPPALMLFDSSKDAFRPCVPLVPGQPLPPEQEQLFMARADREEGVVNVHVARRANVGREEASRQKWNGLPDWKQKDWKLVGWDTEGCSMLCRTMPRPDQRCKTRRCLSRSSLEGQCCEVGCVKEAGILTHRSCSVVGEKPVSRFNHFWSKVV